MLNTEEALKKSDECNAVEINKLREVIKNLQAENARYIERIEELTSELSKLKAQADRHREALQYISKTDTRDPETEDLVIWLNYWRNYTKQIAREALKG